MTKPQWCHVAIGLAAVVFSGGCSLFGVSGYRGDQRPAATESENEEGYAVRSSTGQARKRPEEYIPKEPTEEQKKSLFYSDLGPDTIDVSDYPTQHKYNYTVYSNVCSRCHTLARSINAPVVSRSFWEFYMLGMRTASWVGKYPPITKDERKAILDFLEYDSKIRKVQHKKEFEELTVQLKRYFAPLLEERIRRLQEGKQPQILR